MKKTTLAITFYIAAISYQQLTVIKATNPLLDISIDVSSIPLITTTNAFLTATQTILFEIRIAQEVSLSNNTILKDNTKLITYSKRTKKTINYNSKKIKNSILKAPT
jgi:hypothetical protein